MGTFQENLKYVPAKYKHFNDYSDTLLSFLPKVELKQVVQFRILGIKADPNNKGRLLMPTVGAKPKQRVWDSGHGRFIDIAAIKDIGLNDEPIFFDEELMFRRTEAGHITLNLTDPNHQRLFVFLYLNPENKSFRDRNPSVTPLYEFVDHARTAKGRISEERDLILAKGVILDMTDDEVKAYVASMGGDHNRDIEVLRTVLLDAATQQPKRFLNMSANPEAEARMIIDEALNASILRRVNVKREWQLVATDEVILTSEKGVNMENALVDYFLKNENGKETYRTIKNQLRG